jgi:hypothetical protein
LSPFFPWYLGAGPRVGAVFYSGSQRYVPGPDFHVGGLFETGAVVGAREQWDFSLRFAMGLDGDEPVFSIAAGVGWAFQ